MTLRRSFKMSGCSVLICKMETWLDQISKVLSHSDVPQEWHHGRNAENKVSCFSKRKWQRRDLEDAADRTSAWDGQWDGQLLVPPSEK